MNGPRVWPVFLAYVLAFFTIVSFSLTAAVVVHALHPGRPDREVFDGLPGLVAGGLASALALLFTLSIVARPLSPTRLRLLPGRERGRDLAVTILGVLALGQALDSLTTLARLGDRGSMAVIRHAVEGAAGPDLFGAVLVIGVLAGTAEELFFRAYMQTRLRERWSAPLAIVVTSFCFGLLHFDWIHAVLAFVLALYLGFVTELTGSALPAIAAHVVNNSLFTVLTATVGEVEGAGANVVLLAVGVIVFAGCVLWLRRALAAPRPAS